MNNFRKILAAFIVFSVMFCASAQADPQAPRYSGNTGTITFPLPTASGGTGATSLGDTLTNSGGVLNTTVPADREVTGTTDTILSADAATTVNYRSAAAVAVTLPSAATAGFTQGFSFNPNNYGTGKVEITPVSGLINNAAFFQLVQGDGCSFRSNSTNYLADLSACSAWDYNPNFGTGNMYTLDSRLTATNATTFTCSYINSDGELAYTTAAACQGRVNYGGTEGRTWQGVLIEQASTNIDIRSRPTASAWVNHATSNSTLTFAQTTAPDGTANGALWTRSSTAAAGVSLAGLGTKPASALPYVYSMMFKPNNGTYAALKMNLSTAGDKFDGHFNIETCAVASGGAASGTLTGFFSGTQKLSNGWCLVYAGATSSATGVDIYASFSCNDNNINTDGTDSQSDTSCYVYASQIEQKAYHTSFIPTISTTLTRSADNLVLGSSSGYLLNSEQGTMCIKFVVAGNTVGGTIISDTVADKRLLYFYSATHAGADDGTNDTDFGASAVFESAGAENTACVGYGGTSINVAVNGVLGTAGTFTGDWNLTNIKFFSDYAGANGLSGTIKDFWVYPTKLSDAALVEASNR